MKNLHGTSQIALSLTSTLIARTNPQVNKTFSIHCDTFILLRLTHDFLMNKIHAFHEHKLLNDVEHTGLIFINSHFSRFSFSMSTMRVMAAYNTKGMFNASSLHNSPQ